MADRVATQLRVAVTGGVGSGKSTVATFLAEHGAVRIDADQLARVVVDPGTSGLAAVAARFGPTVLAADGTLDRAALAAVVFSDADARAELNAILHPLIGALADEQMDAAPADAVVVFEIPLLTEAGRVERFDVVVAVEAPLGLRRQRLAERGVSEADARARIAAQVGDEERRRLADEVVVNDGDRTALAGRTADLWARLSAARRAKAVTGR